MGNDQSYIYGERAMLKIIEDPGSVRLKVCPSIEGGVEPNESPWDESENARSIDFDRRGINMLIRDLRRHRDRVFGKDE